MQGVNVLYIVLLVFIDLISRNTNATAFVSLAKEEIKRERILHGMR